MKIIEIWSRRILGKSKAIFIGFWWKSMKLQVDGYSLCWGYSFCFFMEIIETESAEFGLEGKTIVFDFS